MSRDASPASSTADATTTSAADGTTPADPATSATPALPSRLVDALDRVLLRPTWLVVAALAVGYPLLPPLPPAVRFAPFALSVVVFGLPHGAVDHLVPGRLREWRGPGDGVGHDLVGYAAVGLVYAVLGGAYAVAWFLAPVASTVGFVVLTWLHWGQGDVYATLAFLGADHLPTRAERALALVVRGGLPMAVPLVAHPATYREVAAAFVALFDPTAVAGLDPFFTPAARLAVAGTMVGATLLSAGLGAWRVRRGAARRPWLADVGEVVLLWAFFLLVEPILAVGVYFSLWHATRHIARLVAADDPGARALADGDLGTALGRFARDAAPTTAGALVVFAGLFAVVPGATGGREPLFALYLVGIAVLTLPHVAVVGWMDLRQGVWSP